MMQLDEHRFSTVEQKPLTSPEDTHMKDASNFVHMRSVQNPVWLFDIGDEQLFNYSGIIISQYKDPQCNGMS